MRANIDKIHFKSYCWSIGTTSFRMNNFNYNIEQQLIYLKEFFSLPKNSNRTWKNNNDCQKDYYLFLKDKEFVKGDAKKPAKDAREKTSGLVDLGLITDDRRITAVGNRLVEIANNGDFKDNNFFAIDKDSYIYLTQLLKYATDDNIRPFVILLKVLNDLGSISEEEFKYLLPLATTKDTAKKVVESIKKHRSNQFSIDELIISMIKNMDNYRNAYQYFLDTEPSENVFMLINMNRKSPEYEKPYYKFYVSFKNVFVDEEFNKASDLLENINKLNGNAKSYWKKLLFSNTNKANVKKYPKDCLNKIVINNESTDNEVKEFFYYNTHLFKWKSTLDDYYDLNRRYFRVTDIVLFENQKVELTTTAKYYFKNCIDSFFDKSFCKAANFTNLTTVETILGECAPNMDIVYEDVAADFDEEYLDPIEINNRIEEQKLQKFKELIDEKFTKDKLLFYLDCFKERKDSVLNEQITPDADAPTIFEYIIAICWYRISNEHGDILKFMNLSLDSDFLPRRHAGGLESDIVYRYEETDDYPEHNLLIEATLTETTNQRHAEMEPVSRHLMRQIESSNNENDYAILAATNVSYAVVSDFRGRAHRENTLDGNRFFNDLKILALGTNDIKKILEDDIKYPTIYNILDSAHNSNLSLSQGWYQKEILDKL